MERCRCEVRLSVSRHFQGINSQNTSLITFAQQGGHFLSIYSCRAYNFFPFSFSHLSHLVCPWRTHLIKHLVNANGLHSVSLPFFLSTGPAALLHSSAQASTRLKEKKKEKNFAHPRSNSTVSRSKKEAWREAVRLFTFLPLARCVIWMI